MKQQTLSTNTIVRQNKDLLASDIDDEKVMMSMATGQYYGLDSVGREVWDILKKPLAVSLIIDTLQTRFDVDRTTCEKDVLAFLEDLLVEGIIEILDPDVV